MTRPRKAHGHARGRLRDRQQTHQRRWGSRPLCPTTGKRGFAIEADIYLAFRGSPVPVRAYQCPHCGNWHGTQLAAGETWEGREWEAGQAS